MVYLEEIHAELWTEVVLMHIHIWICLQIAVLLHNKLRLAIVKDPREVVTSRSLMADPPANAESVHGKVAQSWTRRCVRCKKPRHAHPIRRRTSSAACRCR
jgi:hypothetical protein